MNAASSPLHRHLNRLPDCLTLCHASVSMSLHIPESWSVPVSAHRMPGPDVPMTTVTRMVSPLFNCPDLITVMRQSDLWSCNPLLCVATDWLGWPTVTAPGWPARDIRGCISEAGDISGDTSGESRCLVRTGVGMTWLTIPCIPCPRPLPLLIWRLVTSWSEDASAELRRTAGRWPGASTSLSSVFSASFCFSSFAFLLCAA